MSEENKSNDMFDDAKQTAKDFSNDAEKVLSDGKNVAIIAHITLIGWIIAIVMNSGEKKTEYASFYIRQMLGIIIIGFVLSMIPIINIIGWILVLILWIMSLVGSLSGEKKPIFLLGTQFQDWFKSI
ncbi:hypothetical protein IA57_03865 [Mangrovimonas yunxiaonensis]|uniref:Import component protein n=1 Tax=Mangrovimonas yunxiaonensis TaxID=1197477 RepID=A0A084TMS1_9FLAO|nr:hypothetical protein [Mangrovimonas yunxiaonensis]KFB02007.1 hypothetical protein IA57_03865 [Mangrovimonas yunxiaonensis]MBR9758240.1 YtxH domain-containing protein [Algicola sp.]GGH45289.1 hypothetical protein GCM10011364_18620 [Mangrovimonas yunxiaonensis]